MSVAVAARCGSLAAVDAALQSGGEVNGCVKGESTALHIAIWRNDLRIVERLLAANASPDIQDTESGWTSLHRALYLGHLSAAALLLDAGALLSIQDYKGRTPLDVLSTSLKAQLLGGTTSEVYSWGNGANYQLGTEAEGLQLTPNRLDSLHGTPIVALAAAKFHSAAVAEDGSLYTWGFGRGGRLGHPEFHIHSGESAVILPRPVAMPGRRTVAAVATGKHHTVAVTRAGELFTWGSNRDGRLGYTAVDTQPTPRRVASMRQRVTAVAAANRHTVVLAEGGTVYSWGSNLQGQLGYGTSDSASNAVPRIVEAIKGRTIKAVAAAKRHTVVLSVEGDVYTWGHRVVTPKRVQLAGARDVARAGPGGGGATGGWEVVFHRGQSQVARPHAVAICAGAAHSACLDQSGAVLAWRSADSGVHVQEVGGALAGKRVVHISAGKYRTAAVTEEGDVYMWEGWSKPAELSSGGRGATGERVAQAMGRPEQQGAASGGGAGGKRPPRPPSSAGGEEAVQDAAAARRGRKSERARALVHQRILPARVEGVKRVTHAAVGEKHSLALQSWCATPLALRMRSASSGALSTALSGHMDRAASAAESVGLAGPWEEEEVMREQRSSGLEDAEKSAYWRSLEALQGPSSRPASAGRQLGGIVSLQRLCERTVARHMVEPRSALALLQFADAAGAELLRQHCLAVALANLDAVILEAQGAFESLPQHLLEQLEEVQRTLTVRATAPPLLQGGYEEAAHASASMQDMTSLLQPQLHRERSFRNHTESSEEAAVARQVRILKKKMQQIEALEARAAPLDPQQRSKVSAKPLLESALALLEAGAPLGEVQALLDAAKDGNSQEELLGTSWDSGTGTPKAVKPSSGRAPEERTSSGARHSSSSRRRRPRAEPSTPSTASSNTSAPASLRVDEVTSRDVPSRVSNFEARLADAGSAPAGSSPVAAALDSAALQPSPMLHTPRQLNESPVASTPSRQQHGFMASPMATSQGWGADATPALAGSSWANMAASGSDAGATSAKAGFGKKPNKQRKGGLSMFLSGALEKTETSIAAPSITTPAGGEAAPWRLAPAAPAAPTSLRAILNQEVAAGNQASVSVSARGRSPSLPTGEDAAVADAGATEAAGGLRIPLAHLLKKSAPIDMAGSVQRTPSETKKPSGPAWGAGGGPEGASPPTSGIHPSLRSIQEEQAQLRESMGRSWGTAGASPVSRGGALAMSSWAMQSSAVNAAAGTSPGAAFPAGTSPTGLSRRMHSYSPGQQPSKWFVQDKPPPQPIRAIQTEEVAIKELGRLYGASNVRLAKGEPMHR
ncbi:g8955 [Coccomyxa elongata]